MSKILNRSRPGSSFLMTGVSKLYIVPRPPTKRWKMKRKGKRIESRALNLKHCHCWTALGSVAQRRRGFFSISIREMRISPDTGDVFRTIFARKEEWLQFSDGNSLVDSKLPMRLVGCGPKQGGSRYRRRMRRGGILLLPSYQHDHCPIGLTIKHSDTPLKGHPSCCIHVFR